MLTTLEWDDDGTDLAPEWDPAFSEFYNLVGFCEDNDVTPEQMVQYLVMLRGAVASRKPFVMQPVWFGMN